MSSPRLSPPAMQVRQGAHFRYALPAGWSVREEPTGVRMLAPDGRTGVSFSLLTGASGHVTPCDFVRWMIQQLGLSDAQLLSVRSLPEQTDPLGTRWQSAEVDATYTHQGTPMCARWTCSVTQSWGTRSVVFRAHQAPRQSWSCDQCWLPAVAESVVVTDPGCVVKEVPGTFSETARAIGI